MAHVKRANVNCVRMSLTWLLFKASMPTHAQDIQFNLFIFIFTILMFCVFQPVFIKHYKQNYNTLQVF